MEIKLIKVELLEIGSNLSKDPKEYKLGFEMINETHDDLQRLIIKVVILNGNEVADDNNTQLTAERLQLKIIGDFEIKNPIDDDIEKAVRINCAAILYPFLREKIATIMMLAGRAPIYLDSQNFVALYDEWVVKKPK